MSNCNTKEVNSESFKDYLCADRTNRTVLLLTGIVTVIQFTIFKYFYPYANFIHDDSFSYIKAAQRNLDVNTYLVGYSRFLRLISVISSSDTFLVSFQYLFLNLSALFLVFTLLYFFNPHRVTKYILVLFIVLNPLFLHLANLVSSDCIFLSLSAIWFGLLLFIIYKPSRNVIICHVLVLFLAFTVRYNALIYPLISILALCLSKTSLKQKALGILGSLLLCGSFVGYTTIKYKQLTGYWQYSPFSGWQLANNAMFTYRYVKSSDRKPVPDKLKQLDSMIRAYFDSTRDVKRFPIENIEASTFYMWSPTLPLMTYRNNIVFKNDTISGELKKWASMGPLYKSYGTFIIKTYPLDFIQHFIWPNANKYYAPPLEFLEAYNSGEKSVSQQAIDWFGYKNNEVKTRMKTNRVIVLSFYPILTGIINVIMLFSLISYISLKGWKISKELNLGIIMGATFWFINACFTICASSAALRFQSFPMILTFIYASILVDWLVKVSKNTKITDCKTTKQTYPERKLINT